MLEIRSRVDDGLIATLYRHDDLVNSDYGRTDLNQPAESLQLAVIRVPELKTFANHKHIPNPRTFELTQESWYVIMGRVLVHLFDIDDTLIEDDLPFMLADGDLLVIHRGGHGYECMAGSVILEPKSGPFTGTEKDKVLL